MSKPAPSATYTYEQLAAALEAIARNAESWHHDDEAKGRALAVIAGWARDPSTIPAGILAAAAAPRGQA